DVFPLVAIDDAWLFVTIFGAGPFVVAILGVPLLSSSRTLRALLAPLRRWARAEPLPVAAAHSLDARTSADLLVTAVGPMIRTLQDIAVRVARDKDWRPHDVADGSAAFVGTTFGAGSRRPARELSDAVV